MAKKEKISMPSSQGGLVRYFDEYHSKIEFKPGYIILFVILIIIIELLLHTQGYRLLGMN
ncbi:preprotein translocase subunit Sec61beta [Candidatus Woesearchaeota archaeon]|jgi:preprotein translocase subunit Sec61beta|nr:preprotein translocase subunit Sec61beta [Candidatus Woesearchaeota archaeon]